MNDSEKKKRAEELFRALAKLAPEMRAEFIDSHCSDPGLREAVLELLETLDGEFGSFLASPDIGAVASDFDPTHNSLPRDIGPYKLLQKIGEGGFGDVYMAQQERPVRRKVALKVLKPGMDSREIITRFEAERQALAMMNHPNIATVLDVGTTETGHPYFVMELVKGIPVTDFCDKSNMPTRERLKLVGDVCAAVEHAHQKGVIHRDLKPSNILVTLHGETPVPKVIDFGVAKAINQPLTENTLFTRYGQMVGTPAYMSPEQADLSGLDVDTRSDVYSLGVLLYELLTGTTPLDMERLQTAGLVEIQRIICEEEPQTPSTRVSSLREGQASLASLRRTDSSKLRNLLRNELDWITMRALEKDRSRRYQSANAFAMDIERYLRDEPVEACPPTASYKLKKFVRKYRASLAVAAAIFVILGVTTTISVWQAIVASYERDNAIGLAVSRDEARKEAQDLAREASASARLASEQEQLAKEQTKIAVEARRQARYDHYASDMNRLGSLFAAGNLRELTRVLDIHRPQTGEIDLRGFEWYHWWRASHREVRTIYKSWHGPGWALALGANGREIAIGYYPGIVTIYDIVRMRKLRDLRTDDDPRFASFSPDGSILAVGAGERIRLFDVEDDWKLMRDLPLTGGWQEAAFAFSPGGDLLASGTPGKATLTLWNTRTWTPRVFEIEGNPLGSNLVFSPDGRWLTFGPSSKHSHRVVLWDVATKKIYRTLSGHEGRVTSVAWSPDGQWLASGNKAGRVRLWSAQLEPVMALKAEGTVSVLVFSPDSTHLAASIRDMNWVAVWNLDTGKRVATIKGHSQPVNGLTFVGNSFNLWTSSTDGKVKAWDLRHAEPSEVIELGPVRQSFHRRSRSDLAVWRSSSFLGLTSITGNQAVIAHEPGNKIERWNVDGLASEAPWDESQNHAAMALSDDGRVAVTVTMAGKLSIWNISGGKKAQANLSVEEAMLERVVKTTVSRDGRIVTIASHVNGDVAIAVFDVPRGTRREIRIRHQDFVDSTLSPRGRYLAVRRVFRVLLWRLEGGDLPKQPHRVIRLAQGPPRCSVFSPDGSQMAIGCWDNNIYFYDVESGRKLFRLEGHGGQVVSLAFSPLGNRLVSGSVDRTVKLWELETRKLLTTLEGHHETVDWVTFAPDMQSIISASTEGGFIRSWPRATIHEANADISHHVEAAQILSNMGNGSALLAELNKVIGIAPNETFLRRWKSKVLTRGGDWKLAFAEQKLCFEIEDGTQESRRPEVEELIATASSWRYFDRGAIEGVSWRQTNYDDANWNEGPAPLGYGEVQGLASNDLRFGPDPKSKHVTTYFRHPFDVAQPDRFYALKMYLRRDDAAVVYINGTEVLRDNLPAESDHETPGEIAVDLDAELRYLRFATSPQVLRNGRNVVAVEVHQAGASSSDLAFDFVLEGHIKQD